MTSSTLGSVTLVGAGPGDPALLTVAAVDAINSASVIVYDKLIGDSITRMLPNDAIKIFVGKTTSNHPVPQVQINQILLDYALKGHNVVRLKGGDPFLFGRGGEELELLNLHNVPFRVIPGITSAIAVPSYAGIPVTHRDLCSSLHIVTGHVRAGKKLDIDFNALVAASGTLVFLMGVTALPVICDGLINAGMDPNTPAAVVQNGTTSFQKRITASLDSLHSEAINNNVSSPAIIIVGHVCSLADKFAWFDSLPLRNTRVVVTRPKNRAGSLSAKLRALGADVFEFPCIHTEPILPCNPLVNAFNSIADFDWVAFTSPAGVIATFANLDLLQLDSRALANLKIAAIGDATSAELRKFGLRADLVPPVFDAAHLGHSLASLNPRNVLILRAELGSPELTLALDSANIPFSDVHCYQTSFASDSSDQLRSLISDNRVDFVTFTSASTVSAFSDIFSDSNLSNLTGVCIGKQTAAQAARLGINTITSDSATIDSLVSAIVDAASSYGAVEV